MRSRREVAKELRRGEWYTSLMICLHHPASKDFSPDPRRRVATEQSEAKSEVARLRLAALGFAAGVAIIFVVWLCADIMIRRAY